MKWVYTKPTAAEWASGDYRITRHTNGALSVMYRERRRLGGAEHLEDAKLMCQEHAEGVQRYYDEQARQASKGQ